MSVDAVSRPASNRLQQQIPRRKDHEVALLFSSLMQTSNHFFKSFVKHTMGSSRLKYNTDASLRTR